MNEPDERVTPIPDPDNGISPTPTPDGRAFLYDYPDELKAAFMDMMARFQSEHVMTCGQLADLFGWWLCLNFIQAITLADFVELRAMMSPPEFKATEDRTNGA